MITRTKYICDPGAGISSSWTLGTHKNDRTLALIAQAGAEVRFLPAYSPDLNPIEMMWSKVKFLLRKAQARTHDDLLLAIAAALRAITAEDALGWFAACGYSFIRNALAREFSRRGVPNHRHGVILG